MNKNVLYTTPDGNYKVCRYSDAERQSIFGFDATSYTIYKKDDNAPVILNGWIPVQWEMTLTDCFKWLLDHNLVTKELLPLLTDE